MKTVGIKRVFWTNSEGGWEGAKVRDLVDMLDGSAAGCGGGGGGGGHDGAAADGVGALGVFVTKHEVLMLRRILGQDGW